MDDRRPTPWKRLALAVSAAALVAATVPSPALAAPARGGCESRNNNTPSKLLECVTPEGVKSHLAAFQEIADNNDNPIYPGSRAAGTKGYSDSVDYVADKLRRAGYQVTLNEFQFRFQSAPAVLQQLTPVNATYETDSFTGSGSGDVTATVTPVDLQLGAGNTSTSGCEAADFAGFPAGTIALIQRGACNFSDKAENAEAAGALGVIIFNQGNDPTREGLAVGTLGGMEVVGIPVVGASYADGLALNQPNSTARVKVSLETRTDVNVIADLPGKNLDNVVMAGAHLDSVGEGPGINDNGSGSAAILETALMMAKHKPQNSLRFAWWGAEEHGLIGSTAYVNGLSQEERNRIALYLNYDMVASPNYIFMIYDANESTYPAPAGVPIPEGSEAIETLYESYYTRVGEPFTDAQFSGRSDYQAFILAGIPSGGLFTGAEGVKTPEQAAIWGGTAGEWYDPCYHQACDTLGNINQHALDVNSDLIAYAQLAFAYSTESVNGVKGVAVPNDKLPKPNKPKAVGKSQKGPHHAEAGKAAS